MWKVSEVKTGDGGNAKRNCRKREGRRGKGGKERGKTDGKKELQEVGGMNGKRENGEKVVEEREEEWEKTGKWRKEKRRKEGWRRNGRKGRV